MNTHSPLTILRVAVPSPLRRFFDYLPPKDGKLQAYEPGMRALVPFGKRNVVGVITAILSHTDIAVNKLKPIKRLLDEQPALPPSILTLCNWGIQYYHHSPGDVFKNALPLALRNESTPLIELVDTWQISTKSRLIELASLSRAPKQVNALTTLRNHPNGLTQTLLAGLDIKSPTLKALRDKGLVELHKKEQSYANWATDSVLRETCLTLNEQQQHAVNTVLNTDQPDNDSKLSFATFLLNGVTGSGKTEVYLQTIEHVLKAGKQALVLVPEIGLTPQTLHRFQQRFNVPVLALHSNLTANQRLSVWRQANAGSAAIIIGTRSALFTPMKHPGLIIIDEEHDLSYKQQDGFRYSARDMAIVRAKIEDIPIILGTATPSFESLHNAKEGRYYALPLTQRAGGAKLPTFEITDLRKAELKNGLCKTLIRSMKHELKQGNQILFFLNRRGYSPVLMCHDCGWNATCVMCDARMTYHRQPTHLHCHHCDYQSRINQHCPECNSTDLRAIGQGTERVDENLSELFPKTRIIRIDRDTTRRKEALENHLKQVNTGEPCILIGTQMLAKGHHFPHVTLVVISDIDSGLFASDFRATEHTAQLILQVAGRAGRAEKPGKVILQSHNPEHMVLQSLQQQNYSAFIQHALPERQLTGLPPYGYIAMLRAEAAHADIASRFLEQVVEQFNNMTSQTVEAWGPVPALMMRKAGRFRYQVMLRSNNRLFLHKAIAELLPRIEPLPDSRKVRWHLDVDPVQLD
ncbi:primosomal protein N' [Gammaproteobacteria bacterium 42_54_T18]|nr:primosomal protein N' [Gammaproteobacteria bacterium 42_54_T18]